MRSRSKAGARSVAAVCAALVVLADDPAVAGGQVLPEGVSVHGFMSQAYGRSDEHQLLGIGPGGTADYRVAALQFRYSLDARSAFVLQLSHERLGRSPVARFEPDVALDWVFFEHRFDDLTTARVGKVRSPIGIYNEIRDVGTLLPFYRPPSTFYGEHLFTAETLDGATLGRRIPLGPWELSVEGLVGSWEFLQGDLETYAKVDAGYGAQVWLSTPVERLRIGAGAVRYTARDLVGTPEGSEDRQLLLTTGLDAALGPLGLRAELLHVDFGEEEIGYSGAVDGFYLEGTYGLTDRLALMGVAGWLDWRLDVPALAFSFDENWDHELAVGVRYAVTPNLVLKLEGHRYRGYGIEDEVVVPWMNDPARTKYVVFSVSTSF